MSFCVSEASQLHLKISGTYFGSGMLGLLDSRSYATIETEKSKLDYQNECNSGCQRNTLVTQQVDFAHRNLALQACLQPGLKAV
jgi:hypothetical protein